MIHHGHHGVSQCRKQKCFPSVFVAILNVSRGGELGIFSICHGCHVIGQCRKQKYFPLVLWPFSIFQGGGGLSIIM